MNKEKVKQTLKKIGNNRFVNKYTVTLAAFLIWIVFFDGNSMLNRLDTYRRQKETDNEIERYREEIATNKALLDALGSETETLERFAREQYRMKCPDEDVYIIKE